MPRKLLRRLLPDRETLGRYALTRRFTPFLMRPELWAIKRSLIAGGLAAGLFSGMIPGPLQMLAAISLAILFRVNLPAAIAGTFCSNPLTILPLYYLAYMIGQWCVGALRAGDMAGSAAFPALPPTDWDSPGLMATAWMNWMLAFGTPLAIGVLLLACLLAVSGYALVQISWRINVLLTVRRRRHARNCRAVV